MSKIRINIDDEYLKNLDSYTYIFEYKGNLFTGIVYETDGKENIIEEMEIKDGKQDGLTIFKDEEGWIYEEENYKQGMLHGLQRSWWNKKQLRSKSIFKNGFIVSNKDWFEDGNLANETKNGITKKWNKNGNLTEFYTGQVNNYKYKESFYEDGKLKSQLIRETRFKSEYREWNQDNKLTYYEQTTYRKLNKLQKLYQREINNNYGNEYYILKQYFYTFGELEKEQIELHSSSLKDKSFEVAFKKWNKKGELIKSSTKTSKKIPFRFSK